MWFDILYIGKIYWFNGENKFVYDERYLSHFVHVRQSRKCKLQLKKY
jgi:hypothetical protein